MDDALATVPVLDEDGLPIANETAPEIVTWLRAKNSQPMRSQWHKAKNRKMLCHDKRQNWKEDLKKKSKS